MTVVEYQYIGTLQDLPEIATKIVKDLGVVKIVGFSGELGAGKTTLIKSICAVLGCADEVSSPTYSIINEYIIENGRIYHMDFYRLKDEEECLDIGFEEYLFSDMYCLIEWPGVAERLLNLPFAKINIEILDNSTRRINLHIHS